MFRMWWPNQYPYIHICRSHAMRSVPKNPLPSTLDEVTKSCPRFRILVIGKTGVGKSSLINYAFNVGSAKVQHNDRGESDINTEIFSDDNPFFVLHDSKGFEAGDTKNLEVVKNFIHERQSKPELKDRLHAIWFCIQIPHAGGRMLEDGDEEFLQLDLRGVPIVTVFTKYDQLVGFYEQDIEAATDEECTRLAELQAEKLFGDLRTQAEKKIGLDRRYAKISTARRYRETLSSLINLTRDLVQQHVEGDIWIIWAEAQRSNAQLNISASIEVGMKQYWPALASNYTPGTTLFNCLDIMHSDIVGVWNFRDPAQILSSGEFRGRILQLVQELGPNGPEGNGSVSGDLGAVQAAIDVVTPLAAVLGPIAAFIGLTATFANWVARSYSKEIPSTLRCLMAYIADLTVVLDRLFMITLARRTIGALALDDVNEAFEEFYVSQDRNEIHQRIRNFVSKAHVGTVLKAENAHEVVIRLIKEYCPSLDSGK